MFRLSRSLLWHSKKLGNNQNIYGSLTLKQKFSEFLDAETKPTEKNTEESMEKKKNYGDNNNVNSSPREADFKIWEPKDVLNDKAVNSSALSRLVSNDEALILSQSMPLHKVIEVMKFLATTKSRPIKLLNALSEKIYLYNKPLTLKQCADVMYCLGMFSLKNVVLLDRLASDIETSHMNFMSGVLPVSILRSCGILKYRNCKLIDILLQKILIPDQSKKVKSFLLALITLATVNYFPPLTSAILQELSNCSVQDYDETKMFLDYVWACVLLGHYSKENISIILSESFVNQLKVAEGYFGHSEPTNMKLMNIQAAVTHLMPTFQCPKLKPIQCGSIVSRAKSQFLESVIDGLSHIFPKNGYLLLNVDTKAGFFLDIECYMDSKGNPIPLSKVRGHKKIGIMLLNFNDFCLGESRVECGLVAFKEKILVAMGYKVVKITQTDYSNNLKLYEKVHYLRKSLETAYEV